jgi:chromosome partitioning protein
MKIWAFVSQKGGAGKSTLATQLGVLAQQLKEQVAIVDLDAQASAFSWYTRRGNATSKKVVEKITRGGPYVMRALSNDLSKIIAAAPTMGATLLMLDTAPATDEGALAAIRAADLIVVPTRPYAFELDALGGTAKLLTLAQRTHLALVVVNGITSGKKNEAAEYDHAVEAVRPFGLRVCTQYICTRRAITDAISEGMGVTERAPEKDAARKEIETLWKELHLFVPTASNVVKIGAAR